MNYVLLFSKVSAYYSPVQAKFRSESEDGSDVRRNWSENGCQVGESSAAQCNSQHPDAQWESKIGLSENNLHGFGAGVDVTLKL